VVVEGRTGSGKTSLARLLAGLYEPDTGLVEVGGGPPAAFAEETLRSHVLYLPQRPWFVGGTIRENLAAEAGVREDDRLLEALARMGLAECVERAGGLDSMLVREHLSLGEASLLHLARAFLTDPGLVILDEPTAALDPATERRVMGHLDRYLNGRTAVLITHRTTLRALGDELWRLGGGRLVEQTPLRRVQREDLR
jgi:ABC-type transport system involved in cytochrome bd biosynthesis fused ATPase/permease subunit